MPGHIGCNLGAAGDDQDGVVAGDTPHDPGHHGVVDGPGEQLGGAGGSSQDPVGAGPLGGDQQRGAPPGQAGGGVGAQGVLGLLRLLEGTGRDLAGGTGLGHGVDELSARGADLRGPQLHQIP